MRRISVVCAIGWLCCCGLWLGGEESPRPNVVFILADDLGWGELGCYGQQKIPTPAIDRLASAGMRFTQFYSGAPVCAPSRCVLMTGKHLGHAEIRGNQQAKVLLPQFTEGQHPISDQAWTLAEAFHEAGYVTGGMGKWGLGPVGSTGEPNRQGFDLFFGYNCQSVAHSYYPETLWRNREKVLINPQPIPGHLPPVKGEVRMEDYLGQVYAPARMVEEAVRFIDANQDRPFFLYLPFTEPHVAMHPPKKTVERFPVEWDREPYRGDNRYLPHPRPRAAYAAMISELDDHVDQVLQQLRKRGLEERTLVIFSSDNGTVLQGRKESHFHTGGADPKFFNSTLDLRGYKGSVYEGGIRVPMIVRWPGKIPAGMVNDTPGYFADWFPTLCAAVNLKRPGGLDGENLWPVMQGGPTASARKPLVWVFPENGGQVAIRMGDFKAVRQQLKTKTPGAWEIYDLKADRGETRDLAASRPDLVQQAIEVCRREVSPNAVFPVPIPELESAPQGTK